MSISEYYRVFLSALEEGDVVRKTTISGASIGHEEIWKEGRKLAENFPSSGGGEILEEVVQAKPHLICFGAGHVAKALYEISSLVGLGMTVVDPRVEMCNEERFAKAEILPLPYEEFFKREHTYYNPFYCIFTHGHSYDRECLKHALSVKHSYIGMIGSKGKVAATFKSLEAEGISPEALESVHAPIGLKIGGDSPEEIAVSIMGEIISVYAKHKHRATADVELMRRVRDAEEGVICRIIRKSGSAPRTEGTMMLVTKEGTEGTIGGGAAELKAIEDGRRCKENMICHYGLSASDDLGMICGGEMDVLFQLL